MKKPIIVVGGGMAGLTAAAFLAGGKQDVLLLEKQEKTGGLVSSFVRQGFVFDGGLRSIENSGIVVPMLRQLGIDIELIRSRVSIGIEDRVLIIDSPESLSAYEEFLASFFPGNAKDIHSIIKQIRRIMGYMDILYGIDNPIFIDVRSDPAYLFKVFLPWMLKYIFTIKKIDRLRKPVDTYLEQFTDNRMLIDIIAQHFFPKTPTFFALSYFKLYLDYRYPRGGTAVLPEKMETFISDHGGIVKTSTPVIRINPEEHSVLDEEGNRYDYETLIWAADLTCLYTQMDIDKIKDPRLRDRLTRRREELFNLEAGESVFSLYLAVDKPTKYFSGLCTEHFFYTPQRSGLSMIREGILPELLQNGTRKQIKDYLADFCTLNTYEISIPALRDSTLAPDGKTGMIVSILFPYQLTTYIADRGWYDEFKGFMEELFIENLDRGIFHGLRNCIIDISSSSPLTMAQRTGNTGGAITGWAFTNPILPVIHRMTRIFDSVETPIPGILQAGQWTYSPAGLPISILTGKLAADRVLKRNS